MNKKILFFIIITFLNFNGLLSSSSIYIKAEIQNEIITNLDIEKEKKYLIFLNPKLRDLEINRIDKIALNSLITEIIKKRELKKVFNFDNQNKIIKIVEENFLKNRNLKNKNELKTLLMEKDLDYELLKSKLKVEALWNQLVYKKFSNNLNIDEVQLRKNILNEFNSKKKRDEYNLSEILFTESISEDFEIKYNKIIQSIEEIGFENSANIFSVSNTAKNGGLIGWINELQINEKIKKNIKDLKINQVSNPIKIPNGYLLIKLNNRREFKEKIDIEDQLKKLIKLESNRQLNNFSMIYFKRLKKNIEINEY